MLAGTVFVDSKLLFHSCLSLQQCIMVKAFAPVQGEVVCNGGRTNLPLNSEEVLLHSDSIR